MAKLAKNLHVVKFKEHDSWIIQCLEYDICSAGKTLQEAERSLELIFAGQLLISGIIDIKPAPEEYWDMPRHEMVVNSFIQILWED